MTSKTYTGGLKEFVYPKGHQPRRLTQKEELGIKDVYEEVSIRKRKEKRVKWKIIILIILIVLGYTILR